MRLDQEHKVFIVSRFARYLTAREIRQDFFEEYEVDLDSKLIHSYNPGKLGNKGRVAKDLRELFDKHRADYEAGILKIPISDKAYRLDLYHRVAVKALLAGNYSVAVEAAKAAEKESPSGKGGGEALNISVSIRGADGVERPLQLALLPEDE